MAGAKCPKCEELTVFEDPIENGKQCSKCGYKATIKPGSGRGTRCMLCGKQTVFNGKCTNCGAKHS